MHYKFPKSSNYHRFPNKIKAKWNIIKHNPPNKQTKPQTNKKQNKKPNQNKATSAFSIKVFSTMEYLKPSNKFSFYEMCHRESTDYF